MHKLFFALIALVFAAGASANCYMGVGMGKSELTKIPTKQNDRILASDYVDGSYTANGTGHTRSAFVGCETPWDTAVELDYTSGIEASLDTHARLVAPRWTDRSIPFTVHEHAEVTSMYGVSAIKFVPVWGAISVYGRLGVARSTARLDVSVPLGNGYSVLHTETKSLTSPNLALGIAWRQVGSPWSARLEERAFAKELRETRLMAVYTF